MTHTASTKCQYQENTSVRSACSASTCPRIASAKTRPITESPIVTCSACSPTRE
jgi:hypothetical protein